MVAVPIYALGSKNDQLRLLVLTTSALIVIEPVELQGEAETGHGHRNRFPAAQTAKAAKCAESNG